MQMMADLLTIFEHKAQADVTTVFCNLFSQLPGFHNQGEP